MAIEVVAPPDLEVHLRHKIDTYRENGTQSVWVVHPECRSVMIYTQDSIIELKGDEKIQEPLLPGFSAPVSAFFELT